MKMSIQARRLAARIQGLCSNPVRSRRMLPILLLAMLTFPSLAGADTQDPYQKRIHTVTTVVVGIISYARWPAKPDPIRLCVTAPVQYAEGLFDPVLLTAPQPIKTLRIEIDNPQLATSCDVVYLGNVNAVQKQDFSTGFRVTRSSASAKRIWNVLLAVPFVCKSATIRRVLK